MTASTPVTPGRIFISYRHKETAAYAGWLFERLADHFGREQIFQDIDSIELGDDFVQDINNAVASCQVLLALIGDKWLTITDREGRRLDNPKDFVRLEIEAALSRDIRVIPILIDGAKMPRADQLPSSLAGLARRQALKLSAESFNFNTDQLLRVLDRTFSKLQAAPAAPDAEIAIAARPPGPDAATEQRIAEVSAGEWAICCSGGGIRTAAYCLGALQSLDQGGLLAQAKWLLGVSGGSYIAASRALVAHDLPPETEPPAYAPGTPEEHKLRTNTRYIAPGGAAGLRGFSQLLFRAIVTFILVSAPLYALAHVWGWLLRWQGALVPSGPHTLTAASPGLAWWLPSAIGAGICLTLLLYSMQIPGDRAGSNSARLAGWVFVLAAGLFLAMLVSPPLISWLSRSAGSVGTIVHFFGFGTRSSWSLFWVVGLIALVTVVARYCQSGLARGNSAAGAQPGLLGLLADQARLRLLPCLASAVVLLAGAVLALLWTSDGARRGYAVAELLPVVVALTVALFGRVIGDVNGLSMHDFYRWRLTDAFAVTRRAVVERDPRRARPLFAEAAATRLSHLRDAQGIAGQPGLVVCGTANINAIRETPRGRGIFSVTFDPEEVTLHGEMGQVVDERARAQTSDYEALVGRRRSTLFDVCAISGIAVSPLIGPVTRQAYRILFTATNVSLGVWLPHPNVVRDARKWIDRHDKDGTGPWWERRSLLLLLWYLGPHWLWGHRSDRAAAREARLWAHVLQRRLDGKPSGTIWYRVMQPTLGLLCAEAAGRLSYRGTWMYVTDGGHYDNLGLVEALRRGASNIVVLDASGESAGTWFGLGEAMGLAKADVGVEIDLDPTSMARGGRHLRRGEVVRPWAHGRFYRPQEAPGLPRQGDIWVCKLGWWTGAPQDVIAYASSHPAYPHDRLEQLYDSAEFRAYQQLGGATVQSATRESRPPLQAVSELRR
jgi:hypothetical protein